MSAGRRIVIVVVAACALPAVPGVAQAHLRSGTVAVDYKASITTARTSAYTAQIYQSDRALNMSLSPGHAVTLLGYLGEPVFRLDAAGLSINDASPTAVVVGLVSKSKRIVARAPHWQLRKGDHSVIWRDGRVQALPSGVTQGVWSVPLIVDGRREHLLGALRRLPKPALWPWVASLLLSLAAAALLVARASRDEQRRVATMLAVVAAGASLFVAIVFSLDAYASPGTWIESFDELFFLAIGVWVLRRGPERWHLAAAIGMGLLALAVGISKGAIFFHPIVLAVAPGVLTRIAVMVAIDAGTVAAIVGGLSYTDALRASEVAASPPIRG